MKRAVAEPAVDAVGERREVARRNALEVEGMATPGQICVEATKHPPVAGSNNRKRWRYRSGEPRRGKVTD
jgi:hypothetical protein